MNPRNTIDSCVVCCFCCWVYLLVLVSCCQHPTFRQNRSYRRALQVPPCNVSPKHSFLLVTFFDIAELTDSSFSQRADFSCFSGTLLAPQRARCSPNNRSGAADRYLIGDLLVNIARHIMYWILSILLIYTPFGYNLHRPRELLPQECLSLR